jgi:2-oxo-4-hydroxy-4-carboxy-5-ureidoimidazoline decarboxylase
MNSVLAQWNAAPESEALAAMLACCAAQRWAAAMVAARPLDSVIALSEAADRIWSTMAEHDWLQAFAAHPRIGDRKPASTQSSTWSQQEQSSVSTAHERTLAQLAEGNAAYELRFGFTYIVCATGKSADEILSILQRRLAETRGNELREAAEQQRQILQLRLGKWLTT